MQSFRQSPRIFTAEGRLQGWTLVVLPFLAFAAMMVVNRQYAQVLLDHRPLLIGTIPDQSPEPIAWTNVNKGGGRVFYTSLGHPDDFQQEPFNRRLSQGFDLLYTRAVLVKQP